MKPVLVTSGEPAGIGPDICLALDTIGHPLVILADKEVLKERAEMLKKKINLVDYQPNVFEYKLADELVVLNIPCPKPTIAGQLNSENATYVLEMLQLAVDTCLKGEFSALITAPVNKAIINQAGFAFTGHTEFLANRTQTETVVMLLACEVMKVGLVTTHLPLKNVAQEITAEKIEQIIRQLHNSLQRDFKISNPRIYVAGLNPHAGEGGYLGSEEIETITPALNKLKEERIDVHGPFPADTLFSPVNLEKADVFVAMYHDQGLPVLKYAGFGKAVNITLGLPFIRTSVDHGTALELAGTGLAHAGSLIQAVELASSMAKARMQK